MDMTVEIKKGRLINKETRSKKRSQQSEIFLQFRETDGGGIGVRRTILREDERQQHDRGRERRERHA